MQPKRCVLPVQRGEQGEAFGQEPGVEKGASMERFSRHLGASHRSVGHNVGINGSLENPLEAFHPELLVVLLEKLGMTLSAGTDHLIGRI